MTHYFSEQPFSKSNIKIHEVNIFNNNFLFKTDHGIFSYDGLDHATRYLLESIDITKLTGRILDFGCGWGPIGIIIKKINPNVLVDMLDINERAIDMATKNIELNKVEINIFKSDMYENVTNKYNYIITNPPIRVGKKILYEILNKAYDYLLPSGCLYLVISKNQGAKSLVKELEKKYLVEIKDKIKGFYIICCKKD